MVEFFAMNQGYLGQAGDSSEKDYESHGVWRIDKKTPPPQWPDAIERFGMDRPPPIEQQIAAATPVWDFDEIREKLRLKQLGIQPVKVVR